MKKQLIFLVYNLLLPVVFLIGFPGWVIKMYRRGGFGTGLMQRLGRYKEGVDTSLHGCVYVHAVSVGEVMIALKLIRFWQEQEPEQKFVIVPTTATGHEVAIKQANQGITVIYSPVDFSWIVKKVLQRFQPKLVVLIESEMWPNLLRNCQRFGIPVAVANARLSPRSEARYLKFKSILEPVFSMVSLVLAQEKEDIQRWEGIGLPIGVVKHTGSIKFDQSGAEQPSKRPEFQEMIDRYADQKKVVMVVSSSPAEEKAIAKSLKPLLERIFLVVVPRHAERRIEVKNDLESVGYDPVLRSELTSSRSELSCMVVDSTGELRDWTAHADVAIIGKSWIAKGGQNPTEAISAGVPVIVGPYMRNFQPLVGELVKNGAVIELASLEGLSQAVESLIGSSEDCEQMCKLAQSVTKIHRGATQRSIGHLIESACTM